MSKQKQKEDNAQERHLLLGADNASINTQGGSFSAFYGFNADVEVDNDNRYNTSLQ